MLRVMPTCCSRAARDYFVREYCSCCRSPHELPVIDPSWLTWNGGCVRAIAEGIRVRRAFAGMPILADALQEAGCENQLVLSHLRGPREHAADFWALNVLLNAGVLKCRDLREVGRWVPVAGVPHASGAEYPRAATKITGLDGLLEGTGVLLSDGMLTDVVTAATAQFPIRHRA